MKYEIKYRYVRSLTGIHVKNLLEKEPNFCPISPIIVNVNLGEQKEVLICDGTYVLDITSWTGIGLRLSKEYDPNPEIKDLIHSKVFGV